MKVTADGVVYDIELPSEMEGFKLSYKEGVAIERAVGKPFADLNESSSLLSAGAIVWILVRRQNPDVQFDDIDFDFDEFFVEPQPVDPQLPPTSS